VRSVGDPTGYDDDLAATLARSCHEPEEFADVVRALSPPVHAYLTRRASRDADDLLAEVWLRAYAARRTFDPVRGTVRVWSFGIARHVMLAHWRRVVDLPCVRRSPSYPSSSASCCCSSPGTG